MYISKWLLTSIGTFSMAANAVTATPSNIHDKPAVEGSIIANLLEYHDNPFLLYPYESNYLLYTFTSNPNRSAISSYSWSQQVNHDEVKFQLSLAFPIWRGILGENSVLAAAYTQDSWWQFSNRKQSSPFRETNYQPQLFLGWSSDYHLGDWTLRDIETGVVHQSNGRSDPTSRSWNRIYARLMAENGNIIAEIKPWVRVDGNGNDDNPDITKYMGHYRAKLGYKIGEAVVSLQGQYNWNSGYGGAELGFSYPLTQHVRFYTQLFSGYGESLIDYNHRQTRIGVGIALNDMF